ncbi:hypothetical protein EV193_103114 [Herbihabitans rhizosphaerae]|uniref:NAD(P)-binding domain-containing protein n=1 Tax=Herbihabitans rhizosphaerae TaxID=1872711 RepID=A0A4Q7KWY9_9PSEU|nr:NAD(P)H-binding protein [Herbihabitans rhizosphaerae]RZS40800.1 hypothetical protein EV193_103114 [Herbihabitans rhizosphaerae]
MKLVLFGATGMVGSRVLAEARARGHEVVAVARDVSTVDGEARGGSVFDAAFVDEVAAGADVLVCAISPRVAPEGTVSEAGVLLLDAARKAGARLAVVGGAGSLELPPGTQVLDAHTVPEEYRAESLAYRELLELLRDKGNSVDWTYLSPAQLIMPGERTGEFRLGGDVLLVNDAGESRISAEDFAVALVDEIENPAHTGRRFTVAY